jgi:hypothetical protein
LRTTSGFLTACVLVLPALAFAGVRAREKAGPTYKAKITTVAGQTFAGANVRRNGKFTDLHLDLGGYSLIVPFEIIRKISFSLGSPQEGEPGLRGEALLGDGSVVKGRAFGSLVRHTDLGDVAIDFSKVQEIEFLQEPAAKYVFKPRGTHSVMLQFDGATKAVSGATFVDDFHHDRLAYSDFFFFEPKGSEKPVKVTWYKIKYLTPGESKYAGTDKYAALVLTTKEGEEHRGSCGNWPGMPQTIEGSIQYSSGYVLGARLHVSGMSDKTALKRIEFQ